MMDLLLDQSRDLKIEKGDFAIGDSTEQNVELLFISTPGQWKERLEAGVAIERASSGNLDRFIDRTIRVQMESDGYQISKLVINEKGVSIEGSYE
jgi:hypothetical protein